MLVEKRQIERRTTAMKIGRMPTMVRTSTGRAWVKVFKMKEYLAEKSRYYTRPK